MSFIKLINTSREKAEFQLFQGNNRIARLGVDGGDSAVIPTTVEISTAQQWSSFAIVRGISTSIVTFSDPGATVTLAANNDEDYGLVVS